MLRSLGQIMVQLNSWIKEPLPVNQIMQLGWFQDFTLINLSNLNELATQLFNSDLG